MKFLFWNAGRRPQGHLLVDLVEHRHPDVLILAERSEEDRSLLRSLNDRGFQYFEMPIIGCTRIHVFSTFMPSHFVTRRETNHYSIRQFSAPGQLSILLGMVHLPSKLYYDDADQLLEAENLRDEIEDLESAVDHRRTLLVGDFNMNPFDKGMFAAPALHSQSCLRVARGKPRIVNNRPHSFFYNPSWNLLGDRNGPAGTYFHGGSAYTTLHWNTFDQVILRPELADRFDRNSLSIVTSAGPHTLLSALGRPAASDHLPIEFRIDLRTEDANEKSVA